MFKQFWQWLTQLGLKPEYDDKLVKRIKLANQFSFIAMLIFFFSGINNIIIGDIFSGLLLEAFASICLTGFFLIKRNLHNFAISFLFTTICSAIFYFDSYSGWASGTYLYYFPIILAIAFIFDFKEDQAKMLFHTSLAICFILINVLTKHKLFESAYLTDLDRAKMFVFNILFSAAAVGFFIYLTVSNNIEESNLYTQRIKEREASEKLIQQALHEKEILLAELHHRVKNNMAIISGLFSFTIDSTKSEEARTVLIESKNRVQSMALIHNKLYQDKNLSNVNFNLYIKELTEEVQNSYPTLKSQINIELNLPPLKLDVSQAIPCGLILNELLTNCYKHAFVGRHAGTINISFIPENNLFKLSVKDNGVGLKDDYNQSESIGLTVIESLCEQLDGKFEYINNQGTQFNLFFTPRKMEE